MSPWPAAFRSSCLSISLLIGLVGCSRHVVELTEQDQPDDAEQYYAMKRAGATDPHARYAAAREQMGLMARYSTVTGTSLRSRIASDSLQSWTFLGPGNIGGRTRTLVIDPTDHKVMYAGGVSGGVWKTIDAGARWEPVGDVLTNLAVNSLVIDPGDHNVLYAGTGEGYFREEVRGTALPLRGNGIFVTRDGGATWQQLSSTSGEDFFWVNDLVISRHDSRRIYAATRTGVWRSDDSGASWSHVLPTTVKGGCLDLAARMDSDSDYLFASCGTFQRATVYRNQFAETGVPWVSVLSDPDMGRTSLAIAPSQPGTIYALSASNQNQALLAVFRSDENGDAGTWRPTVRNTDATKLNRLLLTNPISASGPECFGNQEINTTMGWYCNVIAVDPKNPETVWAAGVDLFRSDDGGRNWGVASYWWIPGPAFAHADHHSIVFDPDYDGLTNETMFTLTDGGVYRTDNARAPVSFGPKATCSAEGSQVVFTSLAHNYGVTQFYNGAVFPDGQAYVGGAQDNGTLLGADDRGIDGWKNINGGDGAFVAINQQNPAIVYAESQNAGFVRSVDGGQTFRGARSGITNDSFLFVAPFVIDPLQPSTLWLGGQKLWRTTNGADSWSVVTGPVDGQISALAVRGDQVLAGTTTGRIYRSPNWAISTPRAGFVSWLALDPHDPSIVYVTYAGFGGSHVWKSADGGATWSALDHNLPDIPIHSIAIDPSGHLYLGSDLGIFVSIDNGANWFVENTGFAPVVTENLVIQNGYVYAFTHGRGAWRAQIVAEKKRRAVGR